MKIISPFKDFYDFKVAKYGIDPLLVYQRRKNAGNEKVHMGIKSQLTRPRPEIQQQFDIPICHHACLWIGHYGIDLFVTKDKVYSFFDTVKDKNNRIKVDKIYCNVGRYNRVAFEQIQFNDQQKFIVLSEFLYLNNCKRNKHIDAEFHHIPILLEEAEPDRSWYYALLKDKSNHLFYHAEPNPNLSSLGIFLDPDFVWQALVEFLSDLRSEKEIMPEVANDDKIRSKGFDIKHSFRPKMKKT